MGIKKSLKEQHQELVDAAHRRGLRVCRDDRLRQTPYRGMNPRSARLLKQPCPPDTITWTPSCRRPKHRKIMDIRHEILEHDKIKKLEKAKVPRKRQYKIAHKYANKRQRNINAVK